MSWVVQRYITLAGGGTLFDPDPSETQPGDVALDGASQPIPTVTAFGGVAWADVVVVDDAGIPQPVGLELFDVGFIKKTVAAYVALGGGVPRPHTSWNRGVLNTVAPGLEQTQGGMEAPAAVIFIVTAGSTVPGSGRLAIRIWKGARP